MALVRVTKESAVTFALALGVYDYIRNHIRNHEDKITIAYQKVCPLYTGDYIDDGSPYEKLCKKNCSVKDVVMGAERQSKTYINCCAVFRLARLIDGEDSVLHLCDSLLDCDVVDI